MDSMRNSKWKSHKNRISYLKSSAYVTFRAVHRILSLFSLHFCLFAMFKTRIQFVLFWNLRTKRFWRFLLALRVQSNEMFSLIICQFTGNNFRCESRTITKQFNVWTERYNFEKAKPKVMSSDDIQIENSEAMQTDTDETNKDEEQISTSQQALKQLNQLTANYSNPTKVNMAQSSASTATTSAGNSKYPVAAISQSVLFPFNPVPFPLISNHKISSGFGRWKNCVHQEPEWYAATNSNWRFIDQCQYK